MKARLLCLIRACTVIETTLQFHFHVIPRYVGDVHDRRGGIRHVIPSKAPLLVAAAHAYP